MAVLTHTTERRPPRLRASTVCVSCGLPIVCRPFGRQWRLVVTSLTRAPRSCRDVGRGLVPRRGQRRAPAARRCTSSRLYSSLTSPAATARASMRSSAACRWPQSCSTASSVLDALVLGVEVALRIGNAVYPDHYDRGWHITGTAGPFGAAVAAGKVLGLDEQRMTWALGLAASQPVGLRESFGSMNKSFNPGRAASNGLFAAILASKGFTSSEGMLEAKRGWANTISTKQDWREITDGLGHRWEAALNTYKPFACGIVLHPAIDGAIQLRNAHHLVPDQIDRVGLRVNPLVLELTGKKTPQKGLEGKFSVYHAVAVALVEGAGGEKQFSDRAVRDPVVVALRSRVVPTVDPAVKPEQVDLTVVLKDGRRFQKHIEKAIGSVEVPMSNKALEAKFADLAEGILPPAQTRRLMDLCWNVEKLPTAADIARAGALTAITGR